MSNVIYFSPSTLGFYPSQLLEAYKSNNNFPTDAEPVSQEVFDTYSATPPTGYVRGLVSGAPGWVAS